MRAASISMQNTLFPEVQNFRLVRITDQDARSKTDWLFHFRQLILKNEVMYPSIEDWFQKRVIAGLRSGERVGYLGLCDEIPVASAVIKKGRTSKFCHLRLNESVQNHGLGELFFILMSLEMRNMADVANFTLPEKLWSEKKEFFSSFGFNDAVVAKRQYRVFEEELFCTAPFTTVISCVRNKLPKVFGRLSVGKHSLISQLLLSLKVENAEKILSGSKSVEIRRRFSKEWENKRATLYASRPIGALVGEADIKRVVVGKPEHIWHEFGHMVDCRREDYDSYIGNVTKVFALVLDNVTTFSERIPISQLSHLLDETLSPPQSYLRLGENEKWSSAVSLAAALQSVLDSRGIHPPSY